MSFARELIDPLFGPNLSQTSPIDQPVPQAHRLFGVTYGVVVRWIVRGIPGEYPDLVQKCQDNKRVEEDTRFTLYDVMLL